MVTPEWNSFTNLQCVALYCAKYSEQENLPLTTNRLGLDHVTTVLWEFGSDQFYLHMIVSRASEVTLQNMDK